ncbi:MAG: hypothetical protein AAFN77_04325 [Planctomycetota bacterium]
MTQIDAIKPVLMRFATLRTPQKIDDEKKPIGFVIHPDPSKDHFLATAIDLTDIEKARAAVRSKLDSFSPLQFNGEVKQLEPKLHQFSNWLMNNRNRITKSELQQHTGSLNTLDDVTLLRIWEQLHFQVLVRRSASVRQACIQMLIANHFLATMSNSVLLKLIQTPRTPDSPTGEAAELEFYRRLAHARIVIDRRLTPKKLPFIKTGTGYFDFGLMNSMLDRAASKSEIQLLKQVQTEVSQLDQMYQEQFRIERGKKLHAHQNDLKARRLDYLKKHKLDAMTPTELKRLDLDAFPRFEFSKFKFEFAAPLSQAFTKDRLSEFALASISANRAESSTIKSFQRLLSSEINQRRQNTAHVRPNKTQMVRIRDGLFRLRTQDDLAFSIAFRRTPLLRGDLKKMYLSIRVGYKNPHVESLSYKLSIGIDTESSEFFETLDNSEQSLTLLLFPKTTLKFKSNVAFKFDATLTLSDGRILKLQCQGNVGKQHNNGIAQLSVPPGANPVVQDIATHHGVNRIGIADYRRVEQEVCCYVPGQVSHIENVMAREYKERHTRQLTSSQTVDELTSELESETLSDSSTTERNELSNEVALVLSEESTLGAGFSTGVGGSIYGVELRADAYIDFASSTASSDSNTMAKNYAQEVTRRALDRLVQKISEKRTSTILREFEENNRHGFDNRAGDQNVTGVYRWIDLIYTNRLVNYGSRLVFEFMIPEPSAFYKQAIQIQAEEANQANPDVEVLNEPDHPSELSGGLQILSATDLTRENYASIAAIYDASVSAPPDQTTAVAQSFTGNPDLAEFSDPLAQPLQVPIDYECTEANASLTFSYDARDILIFHMPESLISVTIGSGDVWTIERENGKDTETETNNFQFDPAIVGSISGSVSGENIKSYTLSVEAICELKDNKFKDWQNSTYEDIINAYNALKAEYDAAINANQAADAANPESEQIDQNPRFNQQVVQDELKRVAIEMLTRPFGINQGQDFYQPGTCDIPQVVQDTAFEQYGNVVKFFEQAFDWNLMSFIFYPYYWADKCRWVELFQAKGSDDHVFRAFLQSGMARLVVPVRVGFEDAVNYFIENGDIWASGGLVVDTDDDLYISIAEELQNTEGIVDDGWQTTVPTTLTIIQKDSASLDEGGLPCCDHVELDGHQNQTIKPSSNVLNLLNNNGN